MELNTSGQDGLKKSIVAFRELPVINKITPCGARTRNLRIRSPTPCPLGQGGHICFVNVRKAFQNKAVWHLQGAQRGASDPLMKKPPTWSLTATGAGLGALGLRGVPCRPSCQAKNTCPRAAGIPLSWLCQCWSTPCGTRTRTLRIRSPTPCPLGQGGHSAYVNIKDAVQNKAAWHLQGAQRGAADPFRPEVSQQRAQALELWDSRACLAGQVPRPGTPVQELLVFH